MAEYASNGKANAGLTTGIIGTSLGGLLTLGSGLLGGMGMGRSICSEDHLVNRFELEKDQQIAKLETENSLLKSNIYTDQKLSDVYERLDGKIRTLEATVNSFKAEQGVINAQVISNISVMQNQIAVLNSLTKTVIPITNVCPEPMARYNSFTAPTTTAAA